MNTKLEIVSQLSLYREGYYTNVITDTVDKFLVYAVRRDSVNRVRCYTHITHFKNNIFLIMFPGLTVGQIEVDSSNIILNIFIFNAAENFYKKYLIKELKKFIGIKLDIHTS
jgi:hypothetical protein